MKQRILFAINGLGLGNSSRCVPLIKEIEKVGVEVDLMSSGKALPFLEHYFPHKEIIALSQPEYGINAKGDFSLFKTLKSLHSFIKVLSKNKRCIEEKLTKRPYSAVILDSIYSYPLDKNLWRGPLVGLNNAIDVFRNRSFYPLQTWGQLSIEAMDLLYYLSQADLIISPTLEENYHRISKFHLTPPIVREEIRYQEPRSPVLKKVLVMLSGSSFQTNLSFLNKELYSSMDITWIQSNKAPIHNNVKLLKEADLLIVNGGLSSLSEVAVLAKPSLVIPLSQHAEQLHNAISISKKGFAKISLTNDHEANFQEVIKNFGSFTNHPPLPSGTKMASRIILESISEF